MHKEIKKEIMTGIVKGGITLTILLALGLSDAGSNSADLTGGNITTVYAAEAAEYDEAQGLLYYGGMIYEVIGGKKEIYLSGYLEEKSKVLKLPKSVAYGKTTYKLTGIHAEALYGSTFIEIVIPDSVTYIGEGAFYDCESLTKITLPKELKSIEAQTFYNCAKLIEMILPENLAFIGEEAFYGCLGLVNMEIPDTVTQIEAYAFSECNNLKEVKLPKNLITLSDGMFQYCGKLSKVTMSEKLKYIGDNVFEECSSLKELKLPNTLLTIGDDSFYECAFKSIKLPKKLTECSDDIFSDCSKLTTVYVPGSSYSYYKELFEGESFKIAKY